LILKWSNFLMIKKHTNESGFSMLELSVASIAALTLGATMLLPNGGLLRAATINDLEDVNAENPSLGDTLVFDGTNWVSTRLSPSYLTDVQLSIVPATGDVLTYIDGRWVNSPAAPPALAELSNINFSGLSSGDALTWDGTKWVNSAIPAPTLNNLEGVNVSNSIVNGQSLFFDGTEWVSGYSGTPGEIKMFPSSSAPAGWLIADGRAVSRTTYSQLFSVIGTTYGAGDGSTTFNLPDFRGRAPVGFNSGDGDFNSMGQTGGAKTHTLTSNEMPSHTHSQNSHGHSGSTGGGAEHGHNTSVTSAGSHSHSAATRATSTSGVSVTSGTNAGRISGLTYATGTTGSQANHTHSISVSTVAHGHGISVSSATASNNNTGGGAAHNNLQPYLTLNFIIKF
jgi:microcystin-dependent protein